MTLLKTPFLQLFTIFISIKIVPCLCDEPTNLIFSCLTHHNINNFFLYSNTNNDEYLKLLNFSMQNLRFSGPSFPKPIAIILPENKEHLVKSVLCCKNSSLEIRVRSGGHSYEGTSSVNFDGASFAIIDMMKLDRVRVDLGSETAWVEGGTTLGQTYYEVSKVSKFHGFSAGSCPTVGISGHILGGGFGLLSRKYGLAADNVADAILIDPNGRVLDRGGMGEDVFWAIRGGGGVFGIIYAWKIKLVPVPVPVTSFIISRSGSNFQVLELINKWQHIAPNLEDEFYLSAVVAASVPEGEGLIRISTTFTGFYLGPTENAVSILTRVFPDLGLVVNDCKEMSWIESILYFSGLGEKSTVLDLKDRYSHGKGYFKAKSDYVRNPISRDGIKGAIEILEKEPKGYIILDPNGGIMGRISSKSIAFPHRKGNLFSIQYLVGWEEVDNDKSDEYIEWIRGFYDFMKPYVSCCPRAAYVNYMDLDLGVMGLINNGSTLENNDVERARVWGEKYFLKNYDRLVRAKTIIDPYNVFRHQQSIPPMSTVKAIKNHVIPRSTTTHTHFHTRFPYTPNKTRV